MFPKNSRKKKLLAKVQQSKPHFEAVSGLDLLAAIEPLLLAHVPHAKDKEYTAWVLRCLRQELEKPKPVKEERVVSKFSNGLNYWAQNPFIPMRDDD